MKYKIKVLTTVVQFSEIPNRWFSRWRMGDRIGYIYKVQYQLVVDKELGEVTRLLCHLTVMCVNDSIDAHHC